MANINGVRRDFYDAIPFQYADDGDWHHFGASWSNDGTFIAYLDGIVVVADNYQTGRGVGVP